MSEGGGAARPAAPPGKRREIPYWLLATVLLALLFLWLIVADGNYRIIFGALRQGVLVTLWVTVVAFALAAALGLVVALGRTSRHRVFREVATFYVEIIRGIPVLVLLFYVAFVGAPYLVRAWNYVFAGPIEAGLWPAITVRDFDMTWRAIVALMVSYSAYLAEIFRAGIEAVPRGQREASWSLGLSRMQTFRLVVLPQAVRTVLPPLGNDFVAMIKDFGAGLGPRRPGHHPARQGLLRLDLPVLRDVQRRCLPLSGNDDLAVAAGAGLGKPPEGEGRAKLMPPSGLATRRPRCEGGAARGRRGSVSAGCRPTATGR